MTSITAEETKVQVPAKSRKAAAEVTVAAPSRREFLYYIWGASIALLLGQAGAALIWFALPRFKEGTFGGVFTLTGDKLPAPNTIPMSEAAGRFHLTHTSEGVLALYGVCTHLGCLPKWSDTNARFECPCHGSKFELGGGYIEGPAPRALDRFAITIVLEDGRELTTDVSGAPVRIDDARVQAIRVDTGRRINGPGI